MKIALSAIDIPQDRPRRDHAGSYIDQLAASMGSAAGQTDPIRVIANGNSFVLVKGLARILAARKLGWEDIEAEPARPADLLAIAAILLEEAAADLTLLPMSDTTPTLWRRATTAHAILKPEGK